MFKKILTFVMLILVMVGLIIGVYFATHSENVEQDQNNKPAYEVFLENVQSKEANVKEFFTYGKTFNLNVTLSGISKDNLETTRLYITDGNEYEKTYNLSNKFDENGDLLISSTEEINTGLILDELPEGKYVALIRLKLNNSVIPRYYSLSNNSEYSNIEYYTITKNESNNKINISFDTIEKEEKNINYLLIDVEKCELPSNIYDIMIDAGHGGTDKGEKSGAITEADLTLEYAKLLKGRLESQGLKVGLTRNDENTSEYTSTNMYDDNGRISIACRSKAKFMFSLHINNGNTGLRGFEIYSPCKSNLKLATSISNKIASYTNIDFSNNRSFKQSDGVYVRNFTKSVITEYTKTAERNGYEPYNLTSDTPFLYTIREVGGIATNAYVDGRNKNFSANKYYKSNQGIECYQIEMGYIKNDIPMLQAQKEEYVTAISEAIFENM